MESKRPRRSSLLRKTIILGAVAYGAQTLLRRARRISLRNKVVVITGASSGHGFVLAKLAAKRGAIPVLAARHEDDLLAAAKDLRQITGEDPLIIPLDIRDQHEVNAAVEKVIDRYGRIDILVNNAGIMTVGPASTMTIENFEEHMQSNLWGALYMTTAVIPHMRRAQFGRIANVVSMGGKRAVPHMLPYTVSKFALTGFTEGMRSELTQDNILLTGIYPSTMRTGGHRHAVIQGKRNAEYAWFGAFATLPGVAASAETVAEHVLDGIIHGDPQRVVGWPASFALAFQSLFPSWCAEVTAIANSFLPDAPDTDVGPVRGGDLRGRVTNLVNSAVPDGVDPGTEDPATLKSQVTDNEAKDAPRTTH